MRQLALLFLFAAMSQCVWALGAPASFRAAKKQAARVYRDHHTTFYCGCAYGTRFSADHQHLAPDLNACGYKVRKQPRRAQRIEWEHVVPAWVFGHQRQCWQKGGRRQCQKDPAFRAMEADLYNLAPAVGEVNGDRSNYGFGLLPDTPDMYGRCDFKVNFRQRLAQPPVNKRGAIARIWLYMADHYHLRLSRQDRQLYGAWNRLYPVSAWEAQRHRRIRAIQGWANPFVAHRLAQPTGQSPSASQQPS